MSLLYFDNDPTNSQSSYIQKIRSSRCKAENPIVQNVLTELSKEFEDQEDQKYHLEKLVENLDSLVEEIEFDTENNQLMFLNLFPITNENVNGIILLILGIIGSVIFDMVIEKV